MLAFTAYTLSFPRFGLRPDPAHYLAQPFPTFVGFVVVAGLVQPMLAAAAILVATVGSKGGGLCARAARFPVSAGVPAPGRRLVRRVPAAPNGALTWRRGIVQCPQLCARR